MAGAESGGPFNAASFRCVAGSGGTELQAIAYAANSGVERVTISAIGLDGLSMTETVVETYDTDPAAALVDWAQSDRCFEWFTSFEDASTLLDAALDDLGYQQFGGDDLGAESASFLVGREGTEEVQIATEWNLDGPQGTFEAESGAAGRFTPIRRGGRSGVWATCGNFYFEVLDLEDSQAIAESVAEAIDGRLCPG